MKLILFLNSDGHEAQVVIETNDPSIQVMINDFFLVKREAHPSVEYLNYTRVPQGGQAK